MARHDDIHRLADGIVARADDRHHELAEALRALGRATDPDLHAWYLADALEAGLEFLVHDSLLGRTGRDFHRRLEAVRVLARHLSRALGDPGDDEDYEAGLDTAP